MMYWKRQDKYLYEHNSGDYTVEVMQFEVNPEYAVTLTDLRVPSDPYDLKYFEREGQALNFMKDWIRENETVAEIEDAI